MSSALPGSRVLQISNYAPPHAGGIEKVAARIFEEMKKRGVAIRWLMSDVPKLPPEPDMVRVPVWNQLEDRLGVPAFIPKPSAYLRLWREVKACDLVHIHDGYYLTCASAALFARLLGKKIMITVHIWDVPYKNPLIQLVQKAVLRCIAMPVIRSVDSTVTINRPIFRTLAALGKNPRYIANGVDPFFVSGRVPVPVAELRARHGLPLDRPVVIFAARYNTKKGLPIVRDIAHALPGTTFVLCGSGPASESPDNWQLPNVVNFGWTKSDKLKELFSCSDLFLLPSRGEGFPLAIQEAMSCGLPCAVFAETWDALDDAREFFVILDDFPTPADAVRAFFAQPRTQAYHGEVAAYAQTRWTVETMMEAYVDVYRATVSSS